MKITQKIWSIIFLMSIIISACDKNEIKPTQEVVTNKTRITLVNAVPGSPNVDVLVNDVKINGSTIAFISRFPLNEYSLATPGSLTLKSVVNTPATIPTAAPNIAFGSVLSTNTSTFEADKYYSVFVIGSPGATISSLLVEDKIPVQTAGKAFIRFVNAMPDGVALDFYSGIVPDGAVNPTTSTAIFSSVSKGTAKDFIAIDASAVGMPYQFQLKTAGTTANVSTAYNLTVVAGKAYTVFSRGFNTTYTIPGFTPARTVAAAPGLTLIVNR